MGYSSEFGKNAAQGGPFPEGPRGNTARPRRYVGNYTFNIPGDLSRPRDNGAEHPGIAPKQAFRKELPAASASDSLLDGQYEPGEGLTYEDVPKTWGGGDYRGGYKRSR